MIDAYWQAIMFLLNPVNLLMMLVAVIIGLIMGIIPGLGGMIGIALFLPMLFKFPADIALTFLVAFHAVVFTGGSITAILLNIPGTGPNAATLIDGFPMTEKGEGSRAIGAAITASTAGGIVPVFLCLGMIPLVLPIVMAFKSAEMAVLILLGLSFMAILTGDSPIRGIISGSFGLLISLIGFQGATGVHRFTFESLFLYEGLGIVGVTLGLFGASELLDISAKGQVTISQKVVVGKLSDVFVGVGDVWRYKWLWLRCTLIGYVVGLLPGIGAETATFVAYGLAKQTSKNSAEFGKGAVEGVIAPESANNAKEAGSLLTTMAFGIPGSAVMAMLLGGFLMVGVIPGPKMLIDHLPLALTLLLGIAVASIIGGIICLFTAPYLARVASVHINFLFPIILVMLVTGSFVAADSMANVVVVVIFGLIGFFMKRNSFSRAALLLGFVLGELFENYTVISIKVFGPTFFLSPISLVLIGIMVATFSFPYVRKVVGNHLKKRDGRDKCN